MQHNLGSSIELWPFFFLHSSYFGFFVFFPFPSDELKHSNVLRQSHLSISKHKYISKPSKMTDHMPRPQWGDTFHTSTGNLSHIYLGITFRNSVGTTGIKFYSFRLKSFDQLLDLIAIQSSLKSNDTIKNSPIKIIRSEKVQDFAQRKRLPFSAVLMVLLEWSFLQPEDLILCSKEDGRNLGSIVSSKGSVVFAKSSSHLLAKIPSSP